jgi:hypothetical protein
MASTNKCLAQSNKSGTESKATMKRRQRGAISCASQVSQRQGPLAGQGCRPLEAVARTTRSSWPSSALDGWSNHARQVRGHRCHRQGAQAQQQEPYLFALSVDPLHRAPAEQVLAQGHLGLQPRGMGRKPCAGRAQGHLLAQGSPMSRPSRSSTQFKCDAPERDTGTGKTARLSWQSDSDCFPMTIQKPITLQEAKSIARHLGLTLRMLRSGVSCRRPPGARP